MRRVERIDDGDDVREWRGVVRVQHRLVELRVRRGTMLAVLLPLLLDLLREIRVLDVALLADGDGLLVHVDRVDDGVAFLPDELELALSTHFHVELLLLLDLLGRLVLRRPGNPRIGVDARHLRPDGRHEQERDEAEEKVDEGDERDFMVRGALATVTTTDVDTGHGLTSLAPVVRSRVAQRPKRRRPRMLVPPLRYVLPNQTVSRPWRLTFWRLATTRFSTWTDASLMSSSSVCVFPLSTAKPTSAVMAARRPNAVQFIASEIPSARMRAFWLGSTDSPPTAPNALMRPTMVPNRPLNIARLAKRARKPVRLLMRGISRSAASSIAAWTSSSGRFTLTSPA